MTYWIISSYREKEVDWPSRWTVEGLINTNKYFPRDNKHNFSSGDVCFLRVFGDMEIIGQVTILKDYQMDSDDDVYYEIKTEIWDFPVNMQNLPNEYKSKIPTRATSSQINEQFYYQLIGIKDFNQNLKIVWKDTLTIHLSEKQVENLLDSIEQPLKNVGLEIIERQKEITTGRKIDLICKDKRGDIIVTELKKQGAQKTIGQLARYVTDVRDLYANRTQKVKAMILASEIDEDLIKAARAVDFDVLLYQVIFG